MVKSLVPNSCSCSRTVRFCEILFAMFFVLIRPSLQAQTISSSEYFFDTDPGTGNGFSLTVPVPDDTVTFTGTISTTGLPRGVHTLFIRTRTSDGFWSLYEPQEFYIRDAIVQAEYFFDADPGVRNGIPISIATPSDSVTITSTISTAGLLPGSHMLFIRTKDQNGKWSLYEPQEFFVKPSIRAAEYFIDTDPGLGNGIPLTVTPAIDSVSFSAAIATPILPNGPHVLFIRTRDNLGKWSLYEPQTFQVGSTLPVELIYFNAVAMNDGTVHTTWQTASETNNDFFTVEKSASGFDFFSFATVDGAGNSTSTLNYDATDGSPYENISYYRLMQTDFDGESTYSNVVPVKFIDQELYFILYPNPSNGVFDISCDWQKESKVEVRIMDNIGQLAFKTKFAVEPGQNRWRIDMPNRTRGLYFIQLNIGSNIEYDKFQIN